MKKKKIISLLIIIYLFIFSQGIYVLEDDNFREIKEKLDSIVKGRYKVGLIVGVKWRGKRYTFPYGIKSLEDEFPPGTRHKYSNSGYGLLGHILARASGKSYERLLQEKIFDPLEMKNSSLVLTAKQMRNIAAGYDLNKNRKSNWIAREVLQGSGFIKSTLNDMFNYLEAAMGLKKTCLDRAFELATTPVQEGYPGSEIFLPAKSLF